ncbi:MAG: MlaD family protein [Pseudomonadota bacterium]
MKHTQAETLLGVLVLLLAIGSMLFFYASFTTASGTTERYFAEFRSIAGLSKGADIQIAGVSVGKVSEYSLNQETYLAELTMNIDKTLLIPSDSVLRIKAEGVLGSSFVELLPGSSSSPMRPGSKFTITIDPTSLEDLLGRAVFLLNQE